MPWLARRTQCQSLAENNTSRLARLAEPRQGCRHIGTRPSQIHLSSFLWSKLERGRANGVGQGSRNISGTRQAIILLCRLMWQRASKLQLHHIRVIGEQGEGEVAVQAWHCFRMLSPPLVLYSTEDAVAHTRVQPLERSATVAVGRSTDGGSDPLEVR